MPTSARKSSVGGARRAPHKYIPYRADDYQLGKKTGIAVEYVDHRSDEFEPFDKVMSQADQRTPPRVQNARKRRTPKAKTPRTPVVQEVDEDGEMSMELEDSIPNSPSAYFKNARVTAITSSVQRVGSSSRPVTHSSDVDFDKVPSPRESPALSHRRSLGHSRTSGPSHLSRSTVAQQDDGDLADGMDFGGPDFDGGGFDSDGDEPPAQSYQGSQHSQRLSSAHTSRRTSFAQMDLEDEDEEEQVEHLTDNEPTPRAKDRQRDTMSVRVQDDDMEDNISRGLAEVEQESMDEEEAVPLRKRTGQDRGDDDSIEKHQRPNKKAKTENEGAKKPRGRPKGSQNIVLRDVTPNDENLDGLRRGRRVRYKPLDWWRCEKVVYGRRESGTSYVPTIKEIRRIPKEEPQPLGGKHRRKRPPRSKSTNADLDANLVHNPEEGWDEDTQAEAPIVDWKTKEELVKRIAFTAKMITPKAAANNDFYFQKIFGDADFIAAGELIIPPDGQKPTKSTKDNTFVFYVIEGAVNLTVHKTSFILATGGMFLVPRGNMYHIRNVCERDARLFFAQARKVSDEEIEEDRRSIGARRSSGSAGPTTAVRSSSELQPPATTAAGAAAMRRAASSKTR